MKLRELDRLSVDEWIDKAVVVKTKIESKLGFKVKTVAITVSASPSVTVTLEPK
jgi:hypothetical protein